MGIWSLLPAAGRPVPGSCVNGSQHTPTGHAARPAGLVLPRQDQLGVQARLALDHADLAPADAGGGAVDAPPAERLVAFTTALISLQREHLPIALASQLRPEDAPAGVYGALRLHVSTLIREIDPALNANIISLMILGAIAAPVLSQLDADADTIAESLTELLRGITGERLPPR
jgi:hypothetical protein